jgi:hypothetical protein
MKGNLKSDQIHISSSANASTPAFDDCRSQIWQTVRRSWCGLAGGDVGGGPDGSVARLGPDDVAAGGVSAAPEPAALGFVVAPGRSAVDSGGRIRVTA